jgi:DNA-binding transcriptional regulator PaaX
MPKTVFSAEQIRDETQTRVAKISADMPEGLRVRIPLPERHPPDAAGRNWNMVPLNEKGTDFAHEIRRIIEDMRTEFILPD